MIALQLPTRDDPEPKGKRRIVRTVWGNTMDHVRSDLRRRRRRIRQRMVEKGNPEMMNGHYTTSTSLGGARYLYNEHNGTVAVFSAGIGDLAYTAIKERIARDGGELLNLDTGDYDAGPLAKLVTV